MSKLKVSTYLVIDTMAMHSVNSCMWLEQDWSQFLPLKKDSTTVTHNHINYHKHKSILGFFAELFFWGAWDGNFAVNHIQLILADCTDIIIRSAGGLLKKPVTFLPSQASIERSPEIDRSKKCRCEGDKKLVLSYHNPGGLKASEQSAKWACTYMTLYREKRNGSKLCLTSENEI